MTTQLVKIGTYDAKACTKCGVVKPLTAFGHHPKGIGNRQARCRTCQDSSRGAGAFYARQRWET